MILILKLLIYRPWYNTTSYIHSTYQNSIRHFWKYLATIVLCILLTFLC